MYATDFEYAGQYLSDFGFIVCSFDGSGGIETVSAGSEITFNKIARNQGKVHSLTGTQYDSCIQTTFQICKSPCIYKEQNITSDEYRELMRWLNRREFLDFQPFADAGEGKDEDREEIHFNASFNVSKIMLNGDIYGLELTMETDKPFGYGVVRNFSKSFGAADVGKIWNIRDYSDEIGSICPKVVIICKADGDLEINNTDEKCITVIKNCKNGETITIDGDLQTISSSLSLANHDIATDFNYDFFRLGNTYSNRDNKITVSLPCDLKVSYKPIIKDIP